MHKELDPVEKKLWALAAKTEDAETISSALQGIRAVRELQHEKSRYSWPNLITALTPVFAMIITAITLVVQTNQSNQKAAFEHDQADEAEWRDVLKNISLENPNSVEMGLFALQGFFDSNSKHAAEARSTAVALLPLTSNEDGFDVIFARLQRTTSESNEKDLFGIGRMAAANERDIIIKSIAQLSEIPDGCKTDYPDAFFSRERCFPDDSTLDSASLKAIWLYSWEIGSVSDGLVKLWNRSHDGAAPKGQNLSGVILEEADLSGIDFSDSDLEAAVISDSNISHARFNNTLLNNASLRSVRQFSDTTWDHANWWDAAKLPCDLAQYLNFKYSPSSDDGKKSATKLITTCVST